MRYHRLGNSGLFVSELSFGAMTFGENRGYPTLGGLGQPEADALVARAFAAGVNLFDTADVYATGESERMLGEALRHLGVGRDKYLIATKAFSPMGDGPNDSGSSRAHLLDAAKASLRRLGVDHIDLYQLHGFDPATPIEESLRALDDLVRQGHVRYIGVSNWAAWQMAKALGVAERLGLTRLTALQAYYSVAGRDLEREIGPWLTSEGVGLLVYSPLAGGFLTGKQARGGKAPEGSRWSTNPFPPIDLERAHGTVDIMRAIATAHQATVAQVALAWLLRQPVVSTVLVGAKRLDQLDDNLRAADLRLDDAELARIDEASALRVEYPQWMFDFMGQGRRELLARSERRR